MAEKEIMFESKLTSKGIFSFKDFYRFCYDWLVDETGLDIIEKKYIEKLQGDVKEIEVEWGGVRKVTDYFKFDVSVKFRVTQLKDIEISRNGVKEKTNQGSVEIKVKGILIRDYQGKFERTAWRKFLRATYEKYIIPARVEQFEDKLIGDMDEFLAQAKTYLELEGKK